MLTWGELLIKTLINSYSKDSIIIDVDHYDSFADSVAFETQINIKKGHSGPLVPDVCVSEIELIKAINIKRRKKFNFSSWREIK